MPTCYLCAAPADTRDHLPPKGFFPPPLPSNLITVPCCKKCNESFSLDDEAFRILVTAPPDISASGQWIQQNRVFEGSFRRSPKLAQNVADSVGPDPEGSGRDVLSLPRKRGDRFLIRLTKGLLAHFYPDFPRGEQKFETRNFSKAEPSTLAQLEVVRDWAKYEERGDGVFRCRHRIGGTPRQEFGIWLYTFYDASLFAVRHQAGKNIAGNSDRQT